MGPPPTEEEQQESLKKWRAEQDKIFNMSDEEFYADSPKRGKFPNRLSSS